MHIMLSFKLFSISRVAMLQQWTNKSKPEQDHFLAVTGHFSVKVDHTQLRKYRSLCNRQVNYIGVEHLLSIRIRN